jgi:hypothetical protein
MKGLPSQIDLTPFAETEFIQLCIGVGQVQFHFSSQNSVNVEGGMIVSDPTGHRRVENYAEGASLLASMLGTRLLDVTGQEDGGVLLRFQGDRNVRVLNDSAQFESFQVVVNGQTHIG